MGRVWGQARRTSWLEWSGEEVSQGVLPPPRLPVLLAKPRLGARSGETCAAPARGAPLTEGNF